MKSMAAAKLVAVVVLLPSLLGVGLAATLPAHHEATEAVAAKPALRRLRPGRQQLAAIVDGSTMEVADLRRYTARSRMASPEMIETWSDSGSAVQSLLATGDLLKLTSGITASTFLAELHAVVDPSEPSRFVGFKGNGVAAETIKAAFEKLGLQTEVQPLGIASELTRMSLSAETQKGLSGNVMGYLRGTDLADEVVIVGCHYDSVNWKNIAGPAPGVDDNASGTALMIMLAKALSQNPVKPRRSVLFVSFQAEEEGLVGSKKFSELFQSGGSGLTKFGKPVGAIVADEVAWPGMTADARKVIFETVGRGKATNTVVDTLAHASQQECGGGHKDCVNGFVVNYNGFGSDHIPLLDVGVPAVLLIERDNMYHADKWGHSDQDTFSHIDASFGAATTRLALQAVASLANPKK